MIEAQQNAGAENLPRRNRRRLRSHLIHSDIRLRLVLDDMLFALIAALAAIGILYYLSNREIGDTLFSAHLSIKETRELLNTGVKVAGVVTFIAVLLFGLWSLIDAHRLVGPLHRLNRLLTEIGDGNLTHEIRFRRRDEFQDLAASADRLVDNYAARLAAIQRQAEAIEQALRAETLTADQVRDLQRQARDLTGQLAYFRLSPEGSAPTVDGSSLT